MSVRGILVTTMLPIGILGTVEKRERKFPFFAETGKKVERKREKEETKREACFYRVRSGKRCARLPPCAVVFAVKVAWAAYAAAPPPGAVGGRPYVCRRLFIKYCAGSGSRPPLPLLLSLRRPVFNWGGSVRLARGRVRANLPSRENAPFGA